MMNLLRIIAGMALLFIGGLMLAFLGPGSMLEEAFFGRYWAAQVFSMSVFFAGVFHMLPRPWAWGESKAGPVRRLMRGMWGMISGLTGMAALALFILAGLDITSGSWEIALLEGMIGAPMLFASAEQLRHIWLKREAELEQEDSGDSVAASNIILRIARHHCGRITPAEVAASSQLHYKDAAAHLHEMSDDGICAPQVNEHGALFFFFAEFADPAAKRDILESAPTNSSDVVFDHDSAATNASSPQEQQASAEVAQPATRGAGKSRG